MPKGKARINAIKLQIFSYRYNSHIFGLFSLAGAGQLTLVKSSRIHDHRQRTLAITIHSFKGSKFSKITRQPTKGKFTKSNTNCQCDNNKSNLRFWKFLQSKQPYYPLGIQAQEHKMKILQECGMKFIYVRGATSNE